MDKANLIEEFIIFMTSKGYIICEYDGWGGTFSQDYQALPPATIVKLKQDFINEQK